MLLALGSGGAEFVHHLLHHHDEAAAAGTPQPADESRCIVHALLRAAVMLVGRIPMLVCIGPFVAFLTLLAQSPTVQSVPIRLDCRGPPARMLPAV